MTAEASRSFETDERLLKLLRDARQQLEIERRRRTEPIAIVGLGCRFPGGVSDPATFWSLLANGVDATREVPPDRWDVEALYDPDPSAVGKCYTKRGGFLDQIDHFEPEFFGISPREAQSLDPQQRLLLEVTWEALENAGIVPATLRGSATGVWVGMSTDDYMRQIMPGGQFERIDAYASLGNARCIAAGRIAYVLGLHGPVLQLDTACSSSLVAIHLAMQSLRSGECDTALVGGVNVIAAPESTIGLCKLHALSQDGRCKTFDAAADGYGRGEGCGVVVLKRLSAAQASQDRIWAVILGSAVNHDGASNGLTAPNGVAQEALLRTALNNSGVEASSVDYVEAHGTGTLLGDPIEVLALDRVYGAQRPAEEPLYLGSVKTNIGHLESAAGISALIKTVLCLSQGALVPSLHLNEPNPKIPWQKLGLRVCTKGMAWPYRKQPARAGVSSFGISGTNAHVLLEAATPLEHGRSAPARAAELVIISARSEAALREFAKRLHELLEQNPGLPLADVAFSLATTRALFERRFALVVPTRQALCRELERVGRGETPPLASEGRAGPMGKLAWLFSGQGAQQLGMGAELQREWPVFRAALDAAFAALDPHLERPLREVMWATPNTPEAELLNETAFTQPGLFALEWALAALFRSWGMEPDFVTGHSLGEISAASVAGVFSLADAARLVCARARLMQALPAGGAMLAIAASKGEVADVLGAYAHRVDLAAINAPSSVVVSGEVGAVSSIAQHFAARGVETTRLNVSHAFHSPLMEPMLEAFRRVAESIAYHTPSVPLISNVSGTLSGPEITTAEYWVQHVRQTVRFAAGVSALHSAGAGTFLELGPRAALSPMVAAALVGKPARILASARARTVETEAVLHALGAWIAQGGSPNWRAIFPAGGRRVPLPSYAWQRDRHWMEPAAQRAAGAATNHPLLGVRVSTAAADAVYESTFSCREPAWLADHRVAGQTVVPGAALLELVRAAGEDHAFGLSRDVAEMLLSQPLIVPERGKQRVQVLLREKDTGSTVATVYSQPADAAAGTAWSLHATASLTSNAQAEPSRLQLEALRARCSEAQDVEAVYAQLAAAGLEYGPAFRGLKRLWRGQGEVLAEIALDPALDPSGFAIHPALLDAAFQALTGLVATTQRLALLPFQLAGFSLHQQGASTLLAYARLLEPASAESLLADVILADAAGNIVAELRGLHARRADVAALRHASFGSMAEGSYRLEWRTAGLEPAAPVPPLTERWAVVTFGEEPRVTEVVTDLRALGAITECVGVAELGAVNAQHVLCCWPESRAAEGALQAAQQGLAVIQGLLDRKPAPRLWWVTLRAQAVKPGEDVAIGGSSVWGLGRSLMQEHPELLCTLIDLDASTAIAETLAREAAATDGEPQVAWRSGLRHTARLVRAPALPSLPSAENYQLQVQPGGTLDGLEFVSSARRAPEPLELELEVAASGLNFRDVLITLGVYPGAPPPLGSECAGVVTRVGERIQGFAVGDRVMALGAGTFSRFVTVDARAVALTPAGMSLEQAATLPIAFLTAFYALRQLAGLRSGERVLVHAAAGGVGMAAVQVAHWIGAEVLATASAPKWGAVREMGVQHVGSSRDLSFIDAFGPTRGTVDVVLNSLSGAFVDASLALLSPGGRFIEMGKADVRSSKDVASAHPGVMYRAFDLVDAGLDRIAEMYRAILAGFASGHLKPLPVRTFAVTEAESAFRFMAQARHVGKLALKHTRTAPGLRGTLLLTGGLGALGLQVARGLARSGAEHLLLIGRQGRSAPGATEAVAELEALGAKVSVAAVDVADRTALARVIAAIPPDQPLRGVVHAAGLLDDGVLSEQSAERFARVMSPKVLGAWNLHTLTERINLDWFVLFSSIAGTLGSAGQAGYAAANSFLDGLAAQRHARGLNGISLAWGPWSNGMAAGLDSPQIARLARLGLSPITPLQGFAWFERSLSRPEASLMFATLDLRRLSKSFAGSIPPLWRGLVRAAAAARAPMASSTWLEELASLSAEGRSQAVLNAVQAEVARVLSFEVAAVPVDTSLRELGLDSLMAVELSNALGKLTGTTIPATLALKHPSVRAMASHVFDSLPARVKEPHSTNERRQAFCEPLNHVEHPQARVFCFHDAGGSAASFAPLAELGAIGVEVHGVSLARGDTQNVQDAADYLRDSVAYISGLADKPFVLLGHSLGSLFAWRVLQELQARRLPLPVLFVPSASPAPERLDVELDPLAVAQFFWSALGAAAQADHLKQAFVADVTLSRALPEPAETVIAVDIAAFVGADDPVSGADTMRGWSKLTTGKFTLSVLPGDHFYFKDERPRRLLMDELADRLAVGRR